MSTFCLMGSIAEIGLPIIVTPFVFLLKQKVLIRCKNDRVRQFIIGLIFGLVGCILITINALDSSIHIYGRDAVPMIAGLLFGGYAGITAGLIGALFRFFAVNFGANMFTKMVAMVGSISAGFLSALLRRYIFEHKTATLGLAFCGAATNEISVVGFFFGINFSQRTRYLTEMRNSLVPMIFTVAATVLVAVMVYKIVSKEVFSFTFKRDKINIISYIQLTFAAVMIIAGVAIIFEENRLNERVAVDNCKVVLSNALTEMENNIDAISEDRMLKAAEGVKENIEEGNYDLNLLKEDYDISEINLFGPDGIVYESTDPSIVGFDIRKGEQSMEFYGLLEGDTEYVQELMPVSEDNTTLKKFAGLSFGQGKGFVQVGYSEEAYHQEINDDIILFSKNKLVGATGGIAVIADGKVVINSSQYECFESVKGTELENLDSYDEGKVYNLFEGKGLDGDGYFVMYSKMENYYIVAFVSAQEIYESREITLFMLVVILVTSFACLYIVLFLLLRNIILNKLGVIEGGLKNISEGNLDEKLKVRGSKEFTSLSNSINSTVDTLKRYIQEAATRIDEELEFAREIQMSSLPIGFKKVLKKTNYDLSAIIDTAKEVGGDFYDFYLADQNKLYFLVADVSGKGIPAAMFMMRSKATIKENIEKEQKLDEAFYTANEELCTENDACMFVTVWQGELDVESGRVSFVCAGHNAPVLKKANGETSFLQMQANTIMGVIPKSSFVKEELTLEQGDMLIVYTDGVTEAKNEEEAFFGDDRLLSFVRDCNASDSKEMCAGIRQAVADFAGEADQFDDITILAIKRL